MSAKTPLISPCCGGQAFVPSPSVKVSWVYFKLLQVAGCPAMMCPTLILRSFACFEGRPRCTRLTPVYYLLLRCWYLVQRTEQLFRGDALASVRLAIPDPIEAWLS